MGVALIGFGEAPLAKLGGFETRALKAMAPPPAVRQHDMYSTQWEAVDGPASGGKGPSSALVVGAKRSSYLTPSSTLAAATASAVTKAAGSLLFATPALSDSACPDMLVAIDAAFDLVRKQMSTQAYYYCTILLYCYTTARLLDCYTTLSTSFASSCCPRSGAWAA